MRTNKKCHDCPQRLECILETDDCFIEPYGMISYDNYEFHILDELVGGMFSIEHFDCPKLPQPDELAMFRLVDRVGLETVKLKCNRCGEEIHLFVLPSKEEPDYDSNKD